jgi:hypothetical protein
MALTSITKDFVIKAGALTEGTSFVTSSTGQTGTLQVTGGAAVAKNLVVGTTATIWGAQTNNSSLTVNGLTTLQGLSAQLTTATSLQVTGAGLFQGQTLFTGAVNTFSGALFVTGTNILTVGTGATNLGGTLGVAGVTSLTNSTTAGSAGNTGALVVTGGILTQDNLVVKSTAYNTATNTANAIYTAGGIYADGGLTVGSAGPVLFKGPVTFSGTATYVLSTNTFYTDNILELHTPPSGVYGTWSSDDGKDIGFRFHYYTNAADQNAALVLANDSKYLEWYGTGAESSGGTFNTATYGTFKTGNIILAGTAGASSTNTGALQVYGGVGINGSIFVAGNVTATNFIGGLTGTATQANNLNGGATGSLPYQSAANTTAMLPIGTNGYILTVSGGNPAWANVSSLSAGNATTATNIAGGTNNQIAYQTAPGQTGFSSNLVFGAGGFTTTNIVLTSGTDSNANNASAGSFITAGGASITKSLYVGGDINLAGSLYLKGVGLDQLTSTTGTFVNVNITGTGQALVVSDSVDINGTTGVYSTNSGALQVTGGVGIGGGLFVGGIVTATTANITGNETVGGSLTVTGYGTISGGSTISALTVTNAATVGTSLAVTGFSSLNGGATLSAATVTNNLTVSGITNLQNTYVTGFTATNNANLMGTASVGSTLSVSGFSSLNAGATISAATITNTLLVNSTAPSLGSASAGAIQTTGGVGIAKDLYVGTTATIAGNLAVSGNETVTGSATVTGFLSANGGATLSAATVTNNLTVSGSETVTGYLTVNGGSTLSATTVTNNATIGGTLGVTGRTTLNDAVVNQTLTATTLVVTGSATLPGNISLSALTVTNLTVTNNETVGGTLTVTGLTALNGGTTTGGFTATGIVSLTNTTDSNATNNGALVVSGGVGIAKNLTVGTAVTVGSATTQTVVNSFYSNNTLLSSYTSGFIQTNSAINLDTFSSTTYRTAKYLIQVVDGTKIHVEEIVVFHDGTNVYMTEYAIATSQGELGTFDAGLSAGTITLTFTANYTPTQMTIKMSRQTITL